MINKILFPPDFVRQITDYALLNAFSVQSKGLNNGKAGLAVALFEVSRFLQDEYIEDRAFELIQEALLGTSGKLDFEYGEAGIGFAIIYLLHNGLLEMDFDDVFGERVERIVSVLERTVSEKGSMWHYHSLLLFLSELDKYKPRPNIQALISRIESDVKNRLKQRIEYCKLPKAGLRLPETLQVFEQYLRWKVLCDQAEIDDELAAQYLYLIRNGKICPDYVIGCYLSVLLHRTPQNILSEIADQVCRQGAKDLYPPGLTLTKQIRILYFMCRYPQLDPEGVYYESLKNNLLKPDLGYLEKVLVDKIDPSQWIAGYGSGIARLLLFIVFGYEREYRQDISRFQVLLG